MNERFKRFVVFLCIFGILTLSLRSQKASAFVDGGVCEVGAIVITSEMIAIGVGLLLVAGGATIYANTDSTDLKHIADGMIKTGEAAKYIAVEIDNQGKAFLSFTQSGLQYIADTINGYHTVGPIATDGGYILSADGSGQPLSFSTITLVNQTCTLKFYCDGVLKGTYYWTGTGTFYLKTLSFNKSSTNVQVYSNTNYLGGCGASGSTSSVFEFTSTITPTFSISHLSNDYNPATAQDVFGSNTVTGSDGSICYQPKVGVPLTDTGSVDSTTGSKVYTPDVSIPYNQTWGDISGDFGITYPTSTATGTGSTTGDTTANPDTTGTIDTGSGIMNIPILGDILKVLRDILSFLKTMIGSLITGIITALKELLITLFVPDASFVKDRFISLESDLVKKFPVDLSLISDVGKTSDKDMDFIYHFTLFGVYLTLDINFIKQVAPYSRMVANGLVAIFLVWYHFRKIVWLIRGSAPIGGDGHSGSSPSNISVGGGFDSLGSGDVKRLN